MVAAACAAVGVPDVGAAVDVLEATGRCGTAAAAAPAAVTAGTTTAVDDEAPPAAAAAAAVELEDAARALPTMVGGAGGIADAPPLVRPPPPAFAAAAPLPIPLPPTPTAAAARAVKTVCSILTALLASAGSIPA